MVGGVELVLGVEVELHELVVLGLAGVGDGVGAVGSDLDGVVGVEIPFTAVLLI